MDVLMGIERFAVTQKITMMVNRYEIRAVAPDGRRAGCSRWRSRSGWRSRSR